MTSKFTRIPVSVVVLGERHHWFRTHSKERARTSREMLDIVERFECGCASWYEQHREGL